MVAMFIVQCIPQFFVRRDNAIHDESSKSNAFLWFWGEPHHVGGWGLEGLGVTPVFVGITFSWNNPSTSHFYRVRVIPFLPVSFPCTTYMVVQAQWKMNVRRTHGCVGPSRSQFIDGPSWLCRCPSGGIYISSSYMKEKEVIPKYRQSCISAPSEGDHWTAPLVSTWRNG